MTELKDWRKKEQLEIKLKIRKTKTPTIDRLQHATRENMKIRLRSRRKQELMLNHQKCLK